MLPLTRTIPLAKKVPDDPPAKTEKTLSRPPAGTGNRKPNAGESRILRGLHRAGDKKCPARGLQNLLLNLYSLVKEHRRGKPRRKGTGAV